jgi:hypothetical protein
MISILIGIAIGIGLIVYSVYDLIYTIQILKNRIEVDALVIGNVERPGGDDGPIYHLVFRYWVNGEPFETRYSTGDDRYKLSSIHRIYCYKNNPKKIVLPIGIIKNTIAGILFIVCGVFLIYMGISEFIG